MVLIRREGVTPSLFEQVLEAEAFLRESLDFHRRATTEARQGEGESPAKVRERMHEIRKLAVSALEEGRRVADEISRTRGIVHDYALDLRDARLEVERLLDRFASQARKNGVPGPSE